MNDLIERLRLGDGTSPDHELLLEAADALEALAQPEQEPVAGEWIVLSESVGKLKELGWNDDAIHKANTPQRTWVGLTDEDKASFWTADQMTGEEWRRLFAEVEAKLKEKNNG